jgi:hypothetical protein
MFRLSPIRSAALAATLLAGSGLAQAIGVTDATGDYVTGFAGSHAGDLDVLGAFVSYSVASDRFVFSGTMNADIGSSAGGLYVWGVNRGAGTAGFAGNGLPGVLFDALVIFNSNGTGSVRTLGAGGGVTTLPPGAIASFGSTIIGRVDGALLPSRGFAKTDYTWNLWPRDGTLPSGFGQISDFAPDNSNLPVTVIGQVPEPASVLSMGLGLGALLLARRRRR